MAGTVAVNPSIRGIDKDLGTELPTDADPRINLPSRGVGLNGKTCAGQDRVLGGPGDASFGGVCGGRIAWPPPDRSQLRHAMEPLV